MTTELPSDAVVADWVGCLVLAVGPAVGMARVADAVRRAEAIVLGDPVLGDMARVATTETADPLAGGIDDIAITLHRELLAWSLSPVRNPAPRVTFCLLVVHTDAVEAERLIRQLAATTVLSEFPIVFRVGALHPHAEPDVVPGTDGSGAVTRMILEAVDATARETEQVAGFAISVAQLHRLAATRRGRPTPAPREAVPAVAGPAASQPAVAHPAYSVGQGAALTPLPPSPVPAPSPVPPPRPGPITLPAVPAAPAPATAVASPISGPLPVAPPVPAPAGQGGARHAAPTPNPPAPADAPPVPSPGQDLADERAEPDPGPSTARPALGRRLLDSARRLAEPRLPSSSVEVIDALSRRGDTVMLLYIVIVSEPVPPPRRSRIRRIDVAMDLAHAIMTTPGAADAEPWYVRAFTADQHLRAAGPLPRPDRLRARDFPERWGEYFDLFDCIADIEDAWQRDTSSFARRGLDDDPYTAVVFLASEPPTGSDDPVRRLAELAAAAEVVWVTFSPDAPEVTEEFSRTGAHFLREHEDVVDEIVQLITGTTDPQQAAAVDARPARPLGSA